ncbi:MAG: cytochrome c biogenesis protein CcdA [SAR202 cluster bacterium]|nr:cytochrome c biogenesis protein CcdA [SAR202 cluster bacterium]
MLIDVPFVFAFSAGLVAAFNPCGAAMFPAYVGYQLDGSEIKSNAFSNGFRAVLLGMSATVGFIVVFATVGVVLAAGGRVLGKFLPFAGLTIGVLITVVGFYLVMSHRRIGIAAASRVSLGEGRGVKSVFLFGIAYAVASLSCALPIFLAAVGIVAGQTLSTGNVVETLLASMTYGLGMGVVLVSATVGIIFFKEAIHRWMRFTFRYIETIGNLAMIGAGAYLVYYWTMGGGRDLLMLRGAQIF